MSFPAVLNTLNCIFTSVIMCLFLQIVKEKDRFRKAPPNYAMKKTQLLKEKVVMFYIHAHVSDGCVYDNKHALRALLLSIVFLC